MELKNIINFHKKERSLVKKIKKEGISYVFQYMKDNKEYFYKIAWAYLQNHDDIEDVFQNTIINAYCAIDTLKKEEFFKTWIATILINECRKVLKIRKKNDISREVEKAHTEVQSYENNNDEKIDLMQSLEKLDSIYKDAIVLKYYGGYSGEEISKILDIPIGTVKSRIHRGLLVLKRALNESEV